MKAASSPGTEEILPLVRELVEVMVRQRRTLQYAVEFIAANIPSAIRSTGHFHLALAQAAASGSPEFENWSLAQAAAALRDPATLLMLHASHIRMGNQAAADALSEDVAEALAGAGRAGDALPHLATLFGAPCSPETSRALLAKRGLAAACLAESARDAASAASVRASLRKHLRYILEGCAPQGEANLICFDFTGDGYAGPEGRANALRDFQALLAEPRAALRERLAETPDLQVVWRGPAGFWYLSHDQAKALDPDPALLETAALCAHYFHPSTAPAEPQPDAVRETRAILAAREGYAVHNLGLLGQILGRALGLEGYAQPEVAGLMASLAGSGSRYAATGLNTEEAYGQFVHFFCITSGLSNAFLSFLMRLYNPPYPAADCNGILGHFAAGDFDRVAKDLKRDGVHVFESRLPDEFVDELLRYAKEGPCYRHGETEKGLEPEAYPESAPAAATYDFIETDLIQVPAIQRLMADPCLYGVSQAYFGSKPCLDAVQMWWSSVFTRKASSEAAQMYHFDLERIQWLKWFVYLTDVDSESGPHCFIRGSHLAGRKPAELMRRGYQRIPDEDMARHFPREDFLEITGKRGTIFVEDTSGFHKGKVPTRSARLAVEIEFSNTLFGTPFPRNARFRKGAYPPLLETARARPQFLGKFVLP